MVDELPAWQQQLEAALARGRKLAEIENSSDYFHDIAQRDDDSLVHRLNRIGEATVGFWLTRLPDDLVKSYFSVGSGPKANVYLLNQRSFQLKRVDRRSTYFEKLHLACEHGFPLEFGQYLFAIARIRNEVTHKLELMDARILDVIAEAFPVETGIDLVDALMLELHDTAGGFAFERGELDRGDCGTYIGFRGHHVLRRLGYSASDLIAKRSSAGPKWQLDEQHGGIDLEIKHAIISGMQKVVGLVTDMAAASH